MAVWCLASTVRRLLLEGRGVRWHGCPVSRPLSPASVRRAHGVLGPMLERARKWGMIRWNPCTDATLPKPVPPDKRVPTPDGIRRLLAACDTVWAEPLHGSQR